MILLTVRVCLARCGPEALYCGIWAYLTREFCFEFTQIIQSFLGPDADIGEVIVVSLCHVLVFTGMDCFIARNLPIDRHYADGKRLLRMPLLLTALLTAIKSVATLVQSQRVEYNVLILTQVICTFFVMATLYGQRMEEKHQKTELELEAQRLLWRQQGA